MDELRKWAEARVAELGGTCPAALTLARFVAPAVRIEPELLRAMRLAVLPGEGLWIEAELWFSRLVRSRSAAGIGLDPAVKEVLKGATCISLENPGGAGADNARKGRHGRGTPAPLPCACA